MKEKILSTLFVLMLTITGCGIDSIFEGGLGFWLFCLLVLLVVAWVLFGGNE